MTKKLKEGDKIRIEGELKRLQWSEDKQEFELVNEQKEVKPLHVGGFSTCVSEKTIHGVKSVTSNVLFKCEKQADNFIRSIELRNKARQAMSDDWGEERPDWDDGSQKKYCIKLICYDCLFVERRGQCYAPLPFRTQKAAEKFRDSITVEDYFLIVGL